MGRLLFIIWVLLVSILMIGLVVQYSTTIPIFTLMWLLISLMVVLKKKSAGSVGFRKVPVKQLVLVTLITFVSTWVIITLVELTTHTYKELIEIAHNGSKPDLTFVWLSEYNGVWGYVFVYLISLFITIFGEELFFRGTLLQYIKRKTNAKLAILLQSFFFSFPHIIIATMMSRIQGIVLVGIYGFVIYGLIGGWAANKTNSIWPSLIVASINNIILVVIYLGI